MRMHVVFKRFHCLGGLFLGRGMWVLSDFTAWQFCFGARACGFKRFYGRLLSTLVNAPISSLANGLVNAPVNALLSTFIATLVNSLMNALVNALVNALLDTRVNARVNALVHTPVNALVILL